MLFLVTNILPSWWLSIFKLSSKFASLKNICLILWTVEFCNWEEEEHGSCLCEVDKRSFQKINSTASMLCEKVRYQRNNIRKYHVCSCRKHFTHHWLIHMFIIVFIVHRMPIKPHFTHSKSFNVYMKCFNNLTINLFFLIWVVECAF